MSSKSMKPDAEAAPVVTLPVRESATMGVIA
jgi:hypothetical protein